MQRLQRLALAIGGSGFVAVLIAIGEAGYKWT
jgi:hypothetical protein